MFNFFVSQYSNLTKNVTFKSPTSVGQTTYGSYPTGYNKDNCAIIAQMSNHNGNWNDEFGNFFAFGLSRNGISCYSVQRVD